jgi:DNA invertase Pin-like site-specific DNA recombinase
VSNSDLITAQHLSRLALVYVRQSSPRQVLTNQESLRLQYALRERAQELGWPPAQIEVIDADLGLTAATAQHRTGFKDLVAKVTLGQVGLVLSVDVTRLARNCTDWYPLLDLCGFRDCLIADRDGVYDPSTANGRLLLGLKGQISELELHTIRARLTAGLLQKAQRGDLALPLPVGLVRDERGAVHKDPNREVQQRIDLVLTTFLEVRSASQTAAVLNQQGLCLPRRDRFGDLVWRRPTVSAVLAILRNPAYAGAFVYGRRQTVRRDPTARRPVQRALPIAAWRIRVPEKYPAYVDWARYEKNQAMLDANRAEYTRDQTRGLPRDGSALLQGIVYCGESGHKLSVIYRPRPYYRCVELRRRYGGPVCQHIPADPVDARVVAAFFAALAPAELDLYEQVMAEQRASAERFTRAHAQQVERLRYEAALAERQFRRVDPDNRLVAAELEGYWEHTLRALKQAEATATRQAQEAVAAIVLSPSLRAALTALGQRLPEIWHTGVLSRAQQKALLRCLIEKVVIHRPLHDRVRTRIVWRGGDTTTFDIPVAVGALDRLASAEELEAKVLALHAAGRPDATIAQTLTDQGYRSPRREIVLESTVRHIRLRQRLFLERSRSHPGRPAGYLSVTQLGKRLGVTDQWLYYRIHCGQIAVARDAAAGLFLFPDDPDLLTQLQHLVAGARKVVQVDREHHHE